MATRAYANTRAARIRRKQRVRATVHGTATQPRLAVYRSLKHIVVQLVDDASGKTMAAARDAELKAGKATPVERAQAVGVLIAEKAKALKITQVVFDRRGYKYHGRVKALADGARSGGLVF